MAHQKFCNYKGVINYHMVVIKVHFRLSKNPPELIERPNTGITLPRFTINSHPCF